MVTLRFVASLISFINTSGLNPFMKKSFPIQFADRSDGELVMTSVACEELNSVQFAFHATSTVLPRIGYDWQKSINKLSINKLDEYLFFFFEKGTWSEF